MEEDNKHYLYLVSNYKPLEVLFAEEMVNGENIDLKIIEDQALKQRLFDLFQMKFSGIEQEERMK